MVTRSLVAAAPESAVSADETSISDGGLRMPPAMTNRSDGSAGSPADARAFSWLTPRRARWAAGLLLAAVTVAVYMPAMLGDFIWDDDQYVTANRNLRSLDGLGRIWSDVRSTPQYYPLVFTSYWMDYHLWGLDPAGYHVVNVLLHAGVALLLWRVLAGLQVPGAYLAAAVFALHPVHVESVAWITERKNVLSGVFYLSALLAWLRYYPLAAITPMPSRGLAHRPVFFWTASLILFALALLSKTAGCSLPVAILILTWWKQGRITWRVIASLIPFFILAVALSLVTIWLERAHVRAEGSAWALPFAGRCLVAGRAFWFYLGKLLYPSNLTFIYEKWIIDPTRWWQYLPPAAVIAALAALWLLRRRIGPGPFAAILFFAVTLAPVLGFFKVYYMQYSFVADHFQYLASMGPLALSAALLTVVLRRWSRLKAAGDAGRPPPAGYIVQGAILGILAALTLHQATIYTNIETLWRDTLRKNPSAWLAHNNLGAMLLDRGDLDGAIHHLSESLRFNPTYVLAHNNLGIALTTSKDLAGAAGHYREAMRIQPDYAPAYKNMGSLLMNQGKSAEAVGYYRKALELRPDWSEVANNLAWILATSPDAAVRREDEAVRLAERAADLTGHDDPTVLDTLAAAYASTGRFDRAVAAAGEAIARASGAHNAQLADEICERLELFRRGRPYREPPPASSSQP